MQHLTISVLIVTRNRPTKLRLCIESLLANVRNITEIIIVDQSSNTQTKNLFTNWKNPSLPIVYLRQKISGKSKGLNYGILQCKSDIIAFTDDDCIASRGWISQIRTAFSSNPNLVCITGNVLPYDEIPELACPPTINFKSHEFSQPIHHSKIGYGNNFAIRKSVFTSIGLFKTWLGPGSKGSNCEDGEIFLRLLTHSYRITHISDMIIFHNKHLNFSELQIQYLSYFKGEMACYGYYSLLGHDFAKKVIYNNYHDMLLNLKSLIINIVKTRKMNAKIWSNFYSVIFHKISGHLIGAFYATADGFRNFIS